MPNSGKIVTLHNNDVVFLAWQYEKPILQCLGFTVRRKDLSQPSPEFVPLPAWVGWQGGSNENWQPKNTDVWPVQKFSWRDFTAKPGGRYQYQVMPMIGTPDNLSADTDLLLTSSVVNLTPDTANNVLAYFNNGILSTQHISHMIPPGPGGAPNCQRLTEHIQTPGDSLRLSLAGQMIEALKSLLQRAETSGGECYCALYELDDEELISALLQAKNKVHVVLSAAGTNDSTNKNSRAALENAGIDLYNRMFSSAHIGHNKFIVYVDGSGTPVSVLAGSTNWTSTGLCAQSNNSVVVNDPAIAQFYFDYWNRLKQDTVDAGNNISALQSEGFRTENNHPNISGDTTIWFSPNTKQKTKPPSPAAPSDMKEVFDLINGAKQAVLFLEFEPGTPSVLDPIKSVEENNPQLFIRGAATDAQAIQKFDDQHPITTELYHRSATSGPDVVYETGVAATAVNDEFAYWKKELLKSSPKAHAIIHDKIVVIDPMSPTDCVVITGSHNQGYKASYANDENLLIFRGNQPLALSYTTHIMDVYDHYRWRFMVQQKQTNAWSGLQTTPDWQDRYFQPASMSYQEIAFWMTAPAATAAAPAAGGAPPPPPQVLAAGAGGGASTPLGHARAANPTAAHHKTGPQTRR